MLTIGFLLLHLSDPVGSVNSDWLRQPFRLSVYTICLSAPSVRLYSTLDGGTKSVLVYLLFGPLTVSSVCTGLHTRAIDKYRHPLIVWRTRFETNTRE